MRQSTKRVRDEKADSNAVINVILASENVKLAESITWTKPKAAKKQRTDDEEQSTQQHTETTAIVSGAETIAAAASTLSVAVTVEHAMEVTSQTAASVSLATAPTSPSKLSFATAGDIVQGTRAALEGWVLACPASAHNTGSFAQSTPSRLRRTASPAYIDALHVLGPLLAQQHYGAALTQLNTIATLFPCHRTQAEYYVLRAFTIEKLQQSDDDVCSLYNAAVECGAQPASGVLEGFQSFERRRNERLGQHSAVASSASTSVGVNVPATPMSRLLHKYKSSRPSLASTSVIAVVPPSAAGVPPATPRSAMLRSKLMDDNEQKDGAPTMTAPTPRSAQLRKLKLTPEFNHTPPAAPAPTMTQQPQEQHEASDDEPPRVDTPRSQPSETVVVVEQTTPQLARNLLDDMQAADEMGTPPMDPRTPSDVLSPLAPLPLSICSPVTVKEVVQQVATETALVVEQEEEEEEEADTSMASPEAPAGLFDEDEYIPGLSTPFPSVEHTQPSVNIDQSTLSRPTLHPCASQSAVQPPPSPSSVVVLASVRASPSVSRALGSEYFVSPVRRSTRHMAVGAVVQSEAQLSIVQKQTMLENAQYEYSYLPNNALQPPRSSSRARPAPKALEAVTSHSQQLLNNPTDVGASPLAITIDAVPASDEEAEPVIKPIPRRGTPMHARRPNANALLPPPPIAQPNLIVLQPVRSPHSTTTSTSSSSSSSSNSAPSLGSLLSSAPFVSPVRRSARHSVDWTEAAHDTLVRLEAGKVSLKPNTSLGDRQQEWKLQAERDRAAMPPPPPRVPRGGKRATTTTATAQQPQQQTVESGVVEVAEPAPAGRFEGGKRHATPRPSGTRRSSRLVARDDDNEESSSDGLAEVERMAHARITRRRSQRFD